MEESRRADGSRAGLYAGIAASVGAVAWLTKFVVIGLGNDSENLHGSLHVLGTVALAIALGTAAWRVAHSRGVGLRVLAVVGALLLFVVVVGAVEEGLNAALDPADDSVLAELVLLVIGIPALVVGLATVRRERRESTGALQRT